VTVNSVVSEGFTEKGAFEQSPPEVRDLACR
jgi:hypothetical protein